MPSNTFKNKVAIITGSSMGIGKAIAVELAKKGASIVLNGRNQETLSKAELELKGFGTKVISVCCDISFPDQANELVNKTLETFGQLDILINNAGISMRGDLVELNPDVYKTVFATNVFGVINTTIPALPFIKKSKGSIVFISSLAGIRGLPGLSAYSSSKMALRAIAESLRIEEAKSEIHVGLIFVGFTEVEHQKKVITADGSLSRINDRSKFKVQSVSTVANAVLNNIRKRKFRTTLTGLGKLNAVFQSIMPNVVEKILIHSIDKIRRRS